MYIERMLNASKGPTLMFQIISEKISQEKFLLEKRHKKSNVWKYFCAQETTKRLKMGL